MEAVERVRHEEAEVLRLTNENTVLLQNNKKLGQELDKYKDASTRHGRQLQEEEAELNFSQAAEQLDNTSEVITYFSQSLPSSSGEAIGVQNENSSFQSIEMSQNGEVMHVDSSAQEPVVAPKRKRTGRHIPITLEEMLQCINDTVKDAAFKLRVSESTVDRRIKDLTNMTWSQFQ